MAEQVPNTRTYEGRIFVRHAERGVVLEDAPPEEQDLGDWIGHALGGDAYRSAGPARVRLTLAVLEGPPW